MNRDKSIDLLYILSCYFNHINPILTERFLENVYESAIFHGIGSYVGSIAIEKGYGKSDRWNKRVQLAIARELALDYEYEEITDFLENNNIWYLPLKGMMLKHLYPESWMREMADIDILYDTRYFNTLNKYMEEHGYSNNSWSGSNCHSYIMGDMYHFEMHKFLFEIDSEFHEYFLKTKDRMIKDQQYNNKYKLKDEDAYIYLIMHCYKHYYGTGTGIRSLLDIFFFLSKKQNTMDWNYIFGEFDSICSKKQLQPRYFEMLLRNIVHKVFDTSYTNEDELYQSFSEQEKKILDDFLHSGTYGNYQHEIERKLEKLTNSPSKSLKSKMRYLLKRLFPDIIWYKANVPFAYEHHWAIPFVAIMRMARGIHKIKNIISEINIIRKL